MFQAARSDYRIPLRAKQRGIALLVMLALILVAFTTIAISRLSLNSAEQKARAKSRQALFQAHEAIMAYAISALPRPDRLSASPTFLTAVPPGTLPCPDITGDGISDPQTGTCPLRRGLFPFITLGIPQPLDSSDSPIWYAIPAEYSGVSSPLNSSVIPTLTLDGVPVAFILIAPNQPIPNQVRTGRFPLATPAVVAQYLEGENANSSLTTYTDIRDNNPTDVIDYATNDQVLAESVNTYWVAVEARVLKEVGDRLREYRNAGCGYPWAAPVGSTNNMPQSTTFAGLLPLANWNAAGCAGATAPAAWVNNHWRTLLYYAICLGPATTLPNPTLSPCLELDVDGDNNDAEAIVISPGVALLGQNRLLPTPPAFPLVNTLLEGENIFTNAPSDNRFLKTKPVNHSGTFNDLIHIVR